MYVPCQGYVGNLNVSETSDAESIDGGLADDVSGVEEDDDDNGPGVLVGGYAVSVSREAVEVVSTEFCVARTKVRVIWTVKGSAGKEEE